MNKCYQNWIRKEVVRMSNYTEKKSDGVRINFRNFELKSRLEVFVSQGLTLFINFVMKD